MVTGEDCT